ncbi:MAG: hypothetical protein EP318_13280 [Rhodobacteraceae bacterium]|nr:MAG: hypothetical protein EP318_13280 [Paracoccaceae bacterium]
MSVMQGCGCGGRAGGPGSGPGLRWERGRAEDRSGRGPRRAARRARAGRESRLRRGVAPAGSPGRGASGLSVPGSPHRRGGGRTRRRDSRFPCPPGSTGSNPSPIAH